MTLMDNITHGLYLMVHENPTLTSRVDVPNGWYIQIERQHVPASLAVGPYPSEEVAFSALTDSLLVDDLCQTDCLDAAVMSTTDLDPVVELLVIDCQDPHHHGPVR